MRHLTIANLTAMLGASTLALAAPLHAHAQEADWDLTRDSENGLVAASTTFDNGLTLMARCLAGNYQVLLAGLPEATGDTRLLLVSTGEDEPRDQRWSVGARAHIAFSDFPAPLARQMRKGGPMQVVVPGGAEGGRNLRYVLDLPISGNAVDQTLGACGRPVDDVRDLEIERLNPEGLPRDITWSRPPAISYPSGSRVYVRGFATVTCLTTPDGRTRDCAVETEQPSDGGFGRAALRAMPAARLVNRAGGEVPPTLIAFTANFKMEDEPPRTARTRLR